MVSQTIKALNSVQAQFKKIPDLTEDQLEQIQAIIAKEVEKNMEWEFWNTPGMPEKDSDDDPESDPEDDPEDDESESDKAPKVKPVRIKKNRPEECCPSDSDSESESDF